MPYIENNWERITKLVLSVFAFMFAGIILFAFVEVLLEKVGWISPSSPEKRSGVSGVPLGMFMGVLLSDWLRQRGITK